VGVAMMRIVRGVYCAREDVWSDDDIGLEPPTRFPPHIDATRRLLIGSLAGYQIESQHLPQHTTTHLHRLDTNMEWSMQASFYNSLAEGCAIQAIAVTMLPSNPQSLPATLFIHYNEVVVPI
jgi:hypothetical protein